MRVHEGVREQHREKSVMMRVCGSNTRGSVTVRVREQDGERV